MTEFPRYPDYLAMAVLPYASFSKVPRVVTARSDKVAVCAVRPRKIFYKDRGFLKYECLHFSLFSFVFHWVFLTSAVTVKIFVLNTFQRVFCVT